MSNLKDFFPPGFVEWQSPVTSSMTMEAGKGYPVNTSSGQITMTLPASASLGDTIEINDYARTFGSNSCIINLNGHNMGGGTFNPEVDVDGTAITLVYVDSTKGWVVQQDDDPPLRSMGPPGNQSFTSTGTSTFTVPSGVTSVCVVCVGAGGKSGIGNSGQAGGGGALAWKNNIAVTPGSTATVTVGAPGNHSGNQGNSGGLSKFTYNGVDYAIAGGGGGGQGDGNQSTGNPGAGGTRSGNYDGGGNGGNGGQDAQNFGGPGGGGAGGYTGNGGNGATSQAAGGGAVSGQAGSGGGGGGGGKGGQSESGGGGGGGVGIFGLGSSGNGGSGQGQNSTGASGGNAGSNGNNGSSGGNQGNHAGGSGGTYGGGHGGPQSSQSAGSPGQGAVRVIWGTGRSFPSNASQA